MDLETVINNVREGLSDCFLYFPKVVDADSLDLTGFEKQESSVKGFDVEYVDQDSGGDDWRLFSWVHGLST